MLLRKFRTAIFGHCATCRKVTFLEKNTCLSSKEYSLCENITRRKCFF